MKIDNTTKRILLISGITIPILLYFWYLLKFSVNIPILDQWDFIPILKSYSNNENWLPLLFEQHNEHRHLFPNLIFLALAELTHWNVQTEMFFSWILCILNFVITFLIFRKTGITSKWVLIPISIMIFSLGQWQSILWGSTLSWFLAVSGILSSVYFLAKVSSSAWYVLPSIVCGILAAFSLNNGLLIWPLGLIQLWFIRKAANGKLMHLIIWLFIGIFIFILYYMDYAKPAHHPPLLLLIEQPEMFLQCWLANLGLGLGGENIPLSVFMGAFVLISFIAFFLLLKSLNKERLHQLMPWIILGLFSLISITLISAARLGLGLKFAIASRYVTISSILVIATAILSTTALNETKNNAAKRKLLGAMNIIFFAVISIGNIITLVMGLEKGERVYIERMKAVVYLNQCDFVPDDGIISVLYPRPLTIRERTPFLKEQKLSLFYKQEEFNLNDYHEMNQAPNERIGSIDNIEVIPPKYLNGRSEVLYIRGWAVNPVTNKIPNAVFLFWDNKLLGRAFLGDYRPDIARLFNDNSLKTAGWEIFTPKIDMAPGIHKITARILFDNNGNYYKDITRELNVK